jgi:hypothetical protein
MGRIEDLQQRIKNLDLDLKRWPVLKTFEILRGCSLKEDLLNHLSIDYKHCPTLEIVIFEVFIDFADFLPNCPRDVAQIRALAFNPQLDIAQFGVDHIWSLIILKQNDEGFKMIHENVKGLKELRCDNLSDLNNLVCTDTLLKLTILEDSSSELKISGLKKLKTLEVWKLAQLDKLVGMNALLELSVVSVSGCELKEYDLSNIAKRFKNLQKCEICVYHSKDLIQPEEYAQIVQDVFQNSATRVEIVFDRRCKDNWCKIYLTKEPYQRCVMKKKNLQR